MSSSSVIDLVCPCALTYWLTPRYADDSELGGRSTATVSWSGGALKPGATSVTVTTNVALSCQWPE